MLNHICLSAHASRTIQNSRGRAGKIKIRDSFFGHKTMDFIQHFHHTNLIVVVVVVKNHFREKEERERGKKREEREKERSEKTEKESREK